MTEEGGQELLSPFHFGYNNPVKYGDTDGKFPIPAIPFIIEGVKFFFALVGTTVNYSEGTFAVFMTKEITRNGGTKLKPNIF